AVTPTYTPVFSPPRRPPRPPLFPYTTLFRSVFQVRQQGALLAQQHAHLNAARQLLLGRVGQQAVAGHRDQLRERGGLQGEVRQRSEEHTSELQSRENLVCRLLLEKKKQKRQQ